MHKETEKTGVKMPTKEEIKEAILDYEVKLADQLDEASKLWQETFASDELDPQNVEMARYVELVRNDLSEKIDNVKSQIETYSRDLAKIEIPKNLPKKNQDTIQSAIIPLTNSFDTMYSIIQEFKVITSSQSDFDFEMSMDRIQELNTQLIQQQRNFERTINKVNGKYGINDFDYFPNN